MMSLRHGESTNNVDMSGERASQRGPINKTYRGRGRGDHRRREFEEKQGKDRRNRLTRIEDGVRPQAESYSEDYNNIPERYNRNDKSFNRNKGNWRNQDRERPYEDASSTKYSQPNINSNTGYEPQPSPSKYKNQKNKNRLWNNPKGDLTVSSKETDDYSDLSVNVEPREEERKGEDDESQRHRLVEQLMGGTYECMVCVDRIKQQHAIWSCGSCYNCFHLGCIKKWAKTSTVETGWRCPACQNTSPKVPNAYMCFCNKLREPEWNRRDTAHSCGEVCGRLRKIEWCTHKCTLLCHPGPCPPCTAYIKKSCACGAESRDVRCSQTEPFFCEGLCGKELNCGGHNCERPCHEGPCGDCKHMIPLNCYCNKNTKEVICSSDTLGQTMFSCESICEHALDCGNHNCSQVCHPSECEPCQSAVERVTRCPCGKVPLEKLYERDGAIQRRSCTDPIPACSQPCQKQLKCGIPGSYHQCQALCHEGPCPQCPSETPVKCRCGFMDKNIPCSELTTKADEVTCEKQCKKMRQCGRHKCAIKCCIDVDHICSLICSRTLKCGLHKCEEACHRGNCPRCWQTSFEELTCHCGASVLYPPVPCGTKPPSCDQPCRRPATCEHTASHNCHPEDTCPPCTLLVDKPCFRGHKTMRSTPCYVPAVSCGAGCQAALPCGIHVCQRVCHDGTCITNGKCPQKCSRPRESCGHPCANPCHQGVCPETVCKEKLKISCSCGLRKVSVQCSDNDREYKAMATNLLATQMQNMNNGLSVDLSHIFTATARPDKLKRLPCTDDCQTQDRNRRLAIALQIENPETREKLGNSSQLYSDFMKDEVRKDPVFAKIVHDALTDLVLKAKESKQRSRSHSFAPMNRDKRQFIHEACEHFGCQSQSYDEEPKKNVVATAVRGMCYLPPLSVLESVQRDQGQKKVPGPVWAPRGTSAGSSKAETQGISSGGMRKLEKSTSLEKETDIGAAKPAIDYFDFDS
ncbi:unnamed protein product [Meganyctiphanes norvegica]|uniref:Protein shuttle craft n=1 Tax=Meganyctiphanes norvegica TaxID=48144 RepID=A0AAV2QVY3_MEGNR